jgi:hypothetical protein
MCLASLGRYSEAAAAARSAITAGTGEYRAMREILIAAAKHRP